MEKVAGLTGYKGRLAIFTSFYSHVAYAPYVRSLATTLGVLSKLGIDHEYLMRPSDFHIERAINNTLTEIMESGDFTDVLLIDSDESWEAEGVVRLLLHPEEIVGGAYRMKNNWNEYVGHLIYKDGFPTGRMLPDGTALLEADRVAAGFLRIKVSALKKLHEAYPGLRSSEPDGIKTQFFTRIIRDGEVHCQDMAFSRMWVDLGEKLWIDPEVRIGHWGMVCHEGYLADHLRGLHKPVNPAIENIMKFAEDIQKRTK